MVVFFLLALVLLLGALLIMLRPLLRQAKTADAVDVQATVALFREKLRELTAEHAAGTLADAQFETSRRDIERQLLDAVSTIKDPAPSGPRRATAAAVGVTLALLIVPVSLYLWKGSPAALLPGGLAGAEADNAAAGDGNGAGGGSPKAKPLTSAQVQKMIDGLVDALKKNPSDAAGWTMLARAYAYQHQYPESVKAFQHAAELNKTDARLLSDMADAMAMANGQKLDGEPIKVVLHALEVDPRDVKALALAGTWAFDHHEYAKAVQYWDRALAANPNDPEFAQTLRASLDEARQLAGGKAPPAPPIDMAANAAPPPAMPASAGPGNGASADPAKAVRGSVRIAPALMAKAKPGDTVFVFARAAQGPKMPLALLRRQVKDLPFDFTLDDSMAMMQDLTLSKYAPVIIGARISRSGDAIAAAGDLQGFSKAVPAGAKGVSITIDQVVP
jgi:cytochrome c-type biogenesis protein CcmH